MPVRISLCFALALVSPLTLRTVRGHEVDQYSVPEGEKLLDMGGYWNDLLYGALSQGVKETNAAIAAEQQSWVPDVGDIRKGLRQSPETLTKNVRGHLPSALSLIESLEAKLELTNLRDAQSGRRLAYRATASESVYGEGMPLPDPRRWNRLLFMRSSTVKIHGHHLGTDKIGHFVAMGYHYHRAYRASRAIGQTHESSLKNACSICGSVTENSFLGCCSTGIYSNADMAANYAGLKFYLNVTRPVQLCGQNVPPMVVRDGEFWKLSPHVGPNCPLLAMFVSVHWDEVLNPSYLDFTVRSQTRRAVQSRSRQLLDWYAGQDPQRRNPEYFQNLLQYCKNYYGEDYGHAGKDDQLLCLGNLCFGDGEQTPTDAPVVRANQTSSVWARAASRNTTKSRDTKSRNSQRQREGKTARVFGGPFPAQR